MTEPQVSDDEVQRLCDKGELDWPLGYFSVNMLQRLARDLHDARAALAKALQAHMDPRACVAHQPLDTDTLGPCAYCETVQMAEERDALRTLLRDLMPHGAHLPSCAVVPTRTTDAHCCTCGYAALAARVAAALR